MSASLLPDALWSLIQPMLPPSQRTQGWQTSTARPSLPHRNSVRPPQRDTVGDAATGAGMRLRHDVLAKAA